LHENVSSINGISISPKKNFVIIKIWSNTIDKTLHQLNKYLHENSIIFKTHSKNIEKDKVSSRFYPKAKQYNGKNKRYQNNHHQNKHRRHKRRYTSH
jgi:hypothetical protein